MLKLKTWLKEKKILKKFQKNHFIEKQFLYDNIIEKKNKFIKKSN